VPGESCPTDRRRGATGVRVIAGLARGRPLLTPPGRTTRPTADRLKQALFNILGEAVPDAAVLDLYAGSGALGIEALSRGARAATFVERDGRAARVLVRNLDRCGLRPAARVLVSDVEAALRRLATEGGEPFTLVLADPPYATGAAPRILALLAAGAASILAPAARVAVEHAAGEEMPDGAGNLILIRRRTQGRGCVSVYGVAAPRAGASQGRTPAAPGEIGEVPACGEVRT
jgi:16S rRNA (guanine966-N2)-methyltransferase